MAGEAQSERTARLEEQQKHMLSLLEKIEITVSKIEAAQAKDIADLAALQNQGRGLLIAVGLFGMAFGALIVAKLGAWFMALMGAFK